MRELWALFFSFAKIGLFTFGGGYSMLPMLQKELVEKRKWTTDDEIVDYFAIGQCTPGVIAVNTATFIGSKRNGALGGIVATLGVIFPSIVIITLIAAFLSNFADLAIVQHAFGGIRVCVCVLILNAVLKLGKKSLPNVLSICIFAVVLLLALWGKIATAYLVLASALFGVILYCIRKRHSKGAEQAIADEKEDKKDAE